MKLLFYKPDLSWSICSDEITEDEDQIYYVVAKALKNNDQAFMQITVNNEVIFIQPEIYKQCLIKIVK